MRFGTRFHISRNRGVQYASETTISMTRPLLFATLAVAGGVAATAIIAATPRAERTHVRKAALRKTLPGAASQPIDTLVAQLHRRFTDTRDIDFGFSRVSRPKVRLHFGPTMDKNNVLWDGPDADMGNERGSGHDRRLIRLKGEEYQLKAEDGTWVNWSDSREQMRPENATEQKAIDSLLKAKREIAIYTFGAFQNGKTRRAKGPAYLRQKGPLVPEAEALRSVADGAWGGDVPDMPGFRIRAEKIFAEASCVKCHNEMRGGDGEAQQPWSDPYKKGDPLGLVLIAEKI